jgi:cysteine-rich repeat protein
MKLSRVAAALPALLLAQPAAAVRPDHVVERSLEVAQGGRARVAAIVESNAPAARAAAWRDFTARRGTAWRAMWDRDTTVPLRVYGEGIAVPGANADAAAAERAAWTLLEEQLPLLAPGAKLDDFTLAANVAHGRGESMRTVSFFQHAGGLPVIGGAVNFLFKNDRMIVMGSTAAPDVAASTPAAAIGKRAALSSAVDWIGDVYGGTPTAVDTEATAVLPIVFERDDGQRVVDHRVVVPVVVDLDEPRAQWTVYVDATTGAPVARQQRLAFGSGTLRYRTSVRHPGGTQHEFPAQYATHTIGGVGVTSDVSGVFTWTGTEAASVVTGLRGPYVQIRNQAGSVASQTVTVQPGGTATWDQATVERVDAQLSAFIHTNLIKEFARTTLNPNLAWLNQTIQVYVNENSTCNAYSTGNDIHFYIQNTQCANTARLADVVYHEFGHSLHRQSIIPGAGAWEGTLGEGQADYLAATFTGDPGMGRGFFHNNNPLRHIDPARDKVYPDDVVGQVHADGEIIGQTLWDLRKAFIAAYGAGPGQTRADDAYYAVIQRAPNIVGAYVEVLAQDDDDGNLANGTPNLCLIDGAFAAHGLADQVVEVGLTRPPVLDHLTLSLDRDPPASACAEPPIQSARATWRLRGSPTTTGTVTFAGSGDTLTAVLPGDAVGEVMQYQVNVTLADGSTKVFPDNAADLWYETYVGPVTELTCWDFESDPVADGWTLTGGFEWGRPTTTASSDPGAAYEGTSILGTDLGAGTADGLYEPNSVASAMSPMVTIDGDWTQVRLQYRRWLAVEDAFYDHAKIVVDGQERWQNLRTTAEDTHHRDREWRFHDLDLTADAADGRVQIRFHLDADEGLEFGGWSIDRLCIVAVGEPACGDGYVTPGEACDDGNLTDGDGCSATCEVEDEEPGPDGPGADDDGAGCCSTSGGPVGGPVALALATVLGLRRRRARQ